MDRHPQLTHHVENFVEVVEVSVQVLSPSFLGGVLYIFTLAGAIPTVRSSVRNRRVRNIIYRLGRQPVEQ